MRGLKNVENHGDVLRTRSLVASQAKLLAPEKIKSHYHMFEVVGSFLHVSFTSSYLKEIGDFLWWMDGGVGENDRVSTHLQ